MPVLEDVARLHYSSLMCLMNHNHRTRQHTAIFFANVMQYTLQLSESCKMFLWSRVVQYSDYRCPWILNNSLGLFSEPSPQYLQFQHCKSEVAGCKVQEGELRQAQGVSNCCTWKGRWNNEWNSECTQLQLTLVTGTTQSSLSYLLYV